MVAGQFDKCFAVVGGIAVSNGYRRTFVASSYFIGNGIGGIAKGQILDIDAFCQDIDLFAPSVDADFFSAATSRAIVNVDLLALTNGDESRSALVGLDGFSRASGEFIEVEKCDDVVYVLEDAGDANLILIGDIVLLFSLRNGVGFEIAF